MEEEGAGKGSASWRWGWEKQRVGEGEGAEDLDECLLLQKLLRHKWARKADSTKRKPNLTFLAVTPPNPPV